MGIRERLAICYKTFNDRCVENNYRIVSHGTNAEDEFEEGAKNLFTYKPTLRKRGIRLNNGPAPLHDDKTVEEWLEEWTASTEDAGAGEANNRVGLAQRVGFPVRTT